MYENINYEKHSSFYYKQSSRIQVNIQKRKEIFEVKEKRNIPETKYFQDF